MSQNKKLIEGLFSELVNSRLQAPEQGLFLNEENNRPNAKFSRQDNFGPDSSFANLECCDNSRSSDEMRHTAPSFLQNDFSLPQVYFQPFASNSISTNANDRTLHTHMYSREALSSPNHDQLYKTELCQTFSATRTCRYGNKCQFAHGTEELRHVTRHPRYKTEICKSFHSTAGCKYGHRCKFIHISKDEDARMALGADNILYSQQIQIQHRRLTSDFYNEPITHAIAFPRSSSTQLESQPLTQQQEVLHSAPTGIRKSNLSRNDRQVVFLSGNCTLQQYDAFTQDLYSQPHVNHMDSVSSNEHRMQMNEKISQTSFPFTPPVPTFGESKNNTLYDLGLPRPLDRFEITKDCLDDGSMLLSPMSKPTRKLSPQTEPLTYL